MPKGFGTNPRDVYDAAAQISILSDGEIRTGITQHPVTEKWQTWVSLHGTDISCFTAHEKRTDAERVAKKIAAAWESGELESGNEVTAFLKSLPSDGLVDPLPQEVLLRLVKLMQKK